MASTNKKSRLLRAFLAASTALTTAHARVHHLFVGNLYPPPRLYALAFDDATLALEVTANMTADASHAWIAFDANRTNVYGASLDKAAIANYEVVVVTTNNNSTTTGNDDYDDDAGATTTATNVTLAFRKSVAAAGACTDKTAAFVLPHPRFPRVYAASWPGPDACAMALSTNPDPTAPGHGTHGGGGLLEEVIQSWRYDSRSNSSGGIHGLALDPEGMALYSADLEGDAVWAHIISPDGTGRVVGLRGRYDLPEKGMHPRHLVVHPNGRVLYVVMEAANVVAAYRLDETTRLPVAEISRHSLLPEGAVVGEYWSAEVMLSEGGNPKYLWATARAWTRNDTIAPHAGFISVFGLDEEGGGEIRGELFRVPTTTLNGGANAISPAPWSEEWAAMTDIGTGYVQMWRIERTTDENGAVTSTTARDVARVDIPDGGCCANVIWYD
ncbi:putative carboxy-cis-cis-muconate cyclase [Apiospora rasikravindrae]|uniref:Carboxy-cis-cis-muconate cyclase n=1 Tax=Apiospora rasikravindrae TaxID=990691 RepID=A0ABR1SFZ4_9PEZI